MTPVNRTEPPSPCLEFSFTEGDWGRIKNQELQTFISEICVVCSHAAPPQGCSQCPVPAVLGVFGDQSLAWDKWTFGGCFWLCLARPCVDCIISFRVFIPLHHLATFLRLFACLGIFQGHGCDCCYCSHVVNESVLIGNSGGQKVTSLPGA